VDADVRESDGGPGWLALLARSILTMSLIRIISPNKTLSIYFEIWTDFDLKDVCACSWCVIRPLQGSSSHLRGPGFTRPILSTEVASASNMSQTSSCDCHAPRRMTRSSSAWTRYSRRCFLEHCFRTLCPRVDSWMVYGTEGRATGGRAPLRSQGVGNK
jgi:hypothetical protein